jgi:FAD/FMN-containing dehydrogenase
MDTMSADATPLERLAGDFGGELIGPDAAEFDEARKVFNGMIDRRPALVARPSGTADVLAAVAYAREQGLPIGVRGGGHSLAGHSTNDGGLVIDLSLMKGVRVDPQRLVARANGGVQWGEYDRETQAFGLATPGGRVTTTGVGGFTLGGGYGWLSPKYGLSCDNLVSVDVVTADGRVLTASEDENEDLFWALRGGGGNFGVVTSFEFRVYPVGPMLYGGLMAFPVERTAEVVAVWRDLAGDSAPDDVSTGAALVTAPPEEFVPKEARLKPAVGIIGCWCGDPAEGERYFAPLKQLGPLVDLFGPIPYRALQAMLDPLSPPGFRTYARGEHLTGLPDAAIEKFATFDTGGLYPLSVGILFQHGGQVSRVRDDATAFSHRDARFMLHPIATWENPADDEKHIGWARSLSEAMREFETGGVYLNFEVDIPQDRVRAGFGDEKYERLVAVKNTYDPENVFRFNQNVKPTAGVAA